MQILIASSCIKIVQPVGCLNGHLKGLCHGSPVHFVNFANFSPSIAMELKVSKEITGK